MNLAAATASPAARIACLRRRSHRSKTPHVLALWDAIGITHELNGYRNDAAGWLNKYGEERELQISALSAVEGLKQAFKTKLQERMAQHTQRVMSRSQFDNVMHVKPNPNGWPEGTRWVPFTGKNDLLKHGPNMGYVVVPQSHIDQSFATHWEKYEDKLDTQALSTFDGHWKKLQQQADAIIDRRTLALVAWLEAPLFIDTLEDFHPSNTVVAPMMRCSFLPPLKLPNKYPDDDDFHHRAK